MRLDALAITLRPRQGWEAIDLGFRMAMHWAWPLWSIWWLIYLPLAAALLAALGEYPVFAALAIWWLKPIPERFVLYVLGRRTFGDTAGIAQTLGAWRDILSPGLIRQLFLRPLGWARGFLSPVPVLERQRGQAARRRSFVLGRRMGGHAIALALVCLLFELATMSTFAILQELIQPSAEVGTLPDEEASDSPFEGWTLSISILYALAAGLIGPLYVAGGFAMYLARRTALEGWDIELTLRRSAEKVQSTRTASWLGALLLATLCLSTVSMTPPAQAEEVETHVEAIAENALDEDVANEDAHAEDASTALDTPAYRAMQEVMAEGIFGGWREVSRWRWKSSERRNTDQPDLGWMRWVGDWMALAFRVGAWLALAALVVAVVWLLAKHYGGQLADKAADVPPPTLFGLAIAPDSLPEDIVAAALAELDAGRLREAVSLLYRGALSFLVHREGMRIGEGSTEGEVLRRAEPLLLPAAAAHFRRLLATWVEIAYGHRAHSVETLRALCHAHRSQFEGAQPAPETPA